MAELKIFKETALPTPLEAHALYMVAPAANPSALEVYVTSADGSVARRLPTITDIDGMIDAKMIGGGGGALIVVADIAARDAISDLTSGMMALVLDASADPTVAAGAATYVYVEGTTNAWTKISEAESLDLVLSWDNLTGRPTSTPAQIDAAVAASHSHSNKTQLDKVGEDAEGNLTYGGSRPTVEWASTGW